MDKIDREGTILDKLPSLVRDNNDRISLLAKRVVEIYSGLVEVNVEELDGIKKEILTFIGLNKQKVDITLEEAIEMIRK